MSWSRLAIGAGLASVVFTFLGLLATIADPKAAAPAALAAGVLVAIGVVIGSDAALAVAVVAAGIGYAIGGIRGISGAVWAAFAGLVAVAGARICFEARRPARIATGAQRAVLIAQVVVLVAVLAAAATLVAMEDVRLGKAWAVFGVAACAAPLFLLRWVNKGQVRRPGVSRAALVAGTLAVLAFAVVAGSVAADRDDPRTVESSTAERPQETPELVQREAAPAPAPEETPTGEWLVALASTFITLFALALLASNWFRDQPLEFKPAEAVPGDSGLMITDALVDDPTAILVSRGQAAGVVQQALQALDDVADPRQAVRLAYSMVEAGFGALDAKRRPTESETEYLRRLLPQLGVGADPMRRLTALFERARFSDHEITAAMRSEAVSALRVVHDELTPESADQT